MRGSLRYAIPGLARSFPERPCLLRPPALPNSELPELARTEVARAAAAALADVKTAAEADLAAAIG